MKLVIAEKPSVAKSIAAVLGAREKKDGYLEGNGYIVSWCVGHLVELAQPDAYFDEWKRWSYDTLPMIPDNFIHEVKVETSSQFKVLKELLHDDRVDSTVNACDAGREGELIFRLVYEQAKSKKPMERLWLSSMEEEAIREGFAHLRPGSEYDALFESAKCRQEADWLVGMNATRLFTVLYQGKVLKVGRVMTPTLAMLVDREAAIMNFKKEPFYVAHIIAGGADAGTEKYKDRTEADQVASLCNGKKALVEAVKNEEKSVAPPKLYDLTTLQREANRIFGFTAKQTLDYTQSLYEKKLVTYPRTDSQYLSDDMEETACNVFYLIFEKMPHTGNMCGVPDFKKVLNSKKVTDHHAIIPTVEIANTDMNGIPESEKKILFLIATRLLCATGEKHTYLSKKVEISCEGVVFRASGKCVTNAGWKGYDEALKKYFGIKKEKEAEEEGNLPDLTEGQQLDVENTRVSEHFTQPPKHFSEYLVSKSEVWIPRRRGAG